MNLERIAKGIGNFKRAAVASGLLGLSVLGAGYMPAHAQQGAVYASNENVVYVDCKKKEENWGQLLSILGFLGGLQSNPNLQDLGDLASLAGQMQHQREVARAGRTQVTVNQGQAQVLQTTIYNFYPNCSFLQNLPLAANSYQDFNQDNHTQLNEFIGVKDRYRDNENINLVFYNLKNKGDLNWYLYGPNGDQIGGGSFPKQKIGTVQWISLNTNWVRENKAYGHYTVVWSSPGKGRFVVRNIFEIVPSQGYSQRSPSGSNNSGAGRNIQIFASYPWVDFDKNGRANFPEEFPNHWKKEFDITERIIFGMYDLESDGIQRRIKWEIYNPQGRVSASDSFNADNGNVLIGQGELMGREDENLTLWLVQNGGYGTHTIKWYVNDVPVGSTSVKILPIREEQNVKSKKQEK